MRKILTIFYLLAFLLCFSYSAQAPSHRKDETIYEVNYIDDMEFLKCEREPELLLVRLELYSVTDILLLKVSANLMKIFIIVVMIF